MSDGPARQVGRLPCAMPSPEVASPTRSVRGSRLPPEPVRFPIEYPLPLDSEFPIMRVAFAFVLLSTVAAGLPAAEERPVAEKYLLSGDLAGGEEALRAILKAHPEDAQARFGLGTVQFVRSVERLIQGFYKHGLQPDLSGGMIPFARLPVPANPKPEPIAYDDLRALFRTFLDDLAEPRGRSPWSRTTRSSSPSASGWSAWTSTGTARRPRRRRSGSSTLA